jgi:hypothetical protein
MELRSAPGASNATHTTRGQGNASLPDDGILGHGPSAHRILGFAGALWFISYRALRTEHGFERNSHSFR